MTMVKSHRTRKTPGNLADTPLAGVLSIYFSIDLPNNLYAATWCFPQIAHGRVKIGVNVEHPRDLANARVNITA
jgi:hypothetical protein